MIVRQATVDDIRFAMANLAPWSAFEFRAAVGGNISIIENGLILARPNLFRLYALCDDDGRPGFVMLICRGEVGELELAGFTTVFFDAIKRPFWLWFARTCMRELDRHAVRSNCSIMAGFDEWHYLLDRLGFKETGARPVHSGREFIDLERLRRTVDRPKSGLLSTRQQGEGLATCATSERD